ncbi:vomeronasal type-2 receptor 26-like [Xenopus laevis]|uniref:Vomeronasal type-2 receptor 26-like n=1 Tax=Xenopus laevis TaxID=8355 RepID=A0A8J1MQW7_XENLA|nr:vomeronasal type-2 receptor 26-like [Xenopus laevis]
MRNRAMMSECYDVFKMYAMSASNVMTSLKKFRGPKRALAKTCRGVSEPPRGFSKDMENCLKCPIYEWPNNEKTRCIAKQTEFLSYEGDSLTLVFIVLSVVSLLLVTVKIGIFISYRDTPLVKANNRNLSFILLFSIKLSFLSVFLFLGRPSDITCILRQTSFGISFSIAMSSVLAKTIMVCIAFKASKPNNPWRKWLGVKITYFIVIICSFIQFLISSIWLTISPPFMELNILSEPGKIIIQYNEGSVIAFYIALSYMGLLASVSFIVAFLARTLPDSFNEAKYITFSMLLFCSVWITMIPAYLSTKGKYMAAVEIFAIISSSCGLLFCIFLPKCYIIIFKPNRNTKQYLLGNSI